MKYDVFISYSSKDQKIVEGICGYLEARGIRCFVAYRDIPRGVVWARAIVEALDNSRMMLVAFSENFNRSEQVDREIELASNDHKPILTFRLSGVDFQGAKKYYLQNLNWIDAFPRPDLVFGDLYENICKLLGIETNGPSKVTSSNEVSQRSTAHHTSPTSPSNPSSNPSSNPPLSNPSITQNNTSHNVRGQATMSSQMEFDPISGEFKQKNSTENLESYKLSSHDGLIAGHGYVDLGLPSGIKWATTNIGASKPEEYGNYYAWSEIKSKLEYTQGNSLLSKKGNWLKKNLYSYNLRLRTSGVVDASGNLTAKYDTPRQNWGNPWRMPTEEEIKELINFTTTELTTVNGIKGILVKSKRNNKTIFLPATGWYKESSKVNISTNGFYWSASIKSEEYSQGAYGMAFSPDNPNKLYNTWNKYWLGAPIRPVTK